MDVFGVECLLWGSDWFVFVIGLVEDDDLYVLDDGFVMY